MKKFLFFLCFATAFEASAPKPMPRDLVHIVETKDAKLFCRVFGKGKPLIVVHGGPGLSQEYLLPQMAKLAEHNMVIFYDQRCSGKSGGNLSDVSLEVFIEDLEAIRKSFPFEKVSILGHSWGGFLAMNYANLHSDKIDKLILLSSMPATSEDFGLFIQEYMKRTEPLTEELEAIRKSEEYKAGEPATVTKHLRLMFGAYCASPESVYELNFNATQQENLNASAIHGIIAQSVFLKPFNLDLSNVACKTLVIHGDHDMVPLIAAQNLQKKIAGAEFVTLKDCGHFPFVEKPDELFDTLEQFLNP